MAMKRFREFLRDRRGSIYMMYALSLPVLVFGVGAAVDYGRASQLRTKLTAAADSAALAALTPNMLQQSNDVAKAAAVSMFNGLTSNISGLAAGSTSVTVTVTNPGGNALIRNVTVSFSSAEQALFGAVLGISTIPLLNASTASAQIPPNIDFYVLLDNSPSMLLPSTMNGVDAMQKLTPDEGSGGCAFACHEASTNNSDSAGNPCLNPNTGAYTSPTLNWSWQPVTSGAVFCQTNAALTTYQGPQIDNLALARLNNITLRLDELNSAVGTLTQTASGYATSSLFSTPPNYRFSISEMDSSWEIGFNNIMALTANYVSGWASAAASFGSTEYYSNGDGCGNAACTYGNGTNDVATNYDDALSNINALMPNPGNGSNVVGDTPKEVLFIVTDGVEDEENGGRIIQAINGGVGHNYCSDIKARGIQIAILYTEYLPVYANSFYVDNVEAFQDDIGPALQACASPGLYIDAAIGTDLSQALASLFNAVVQTGHLTE